MDDHQDRETAGVARTSGSQCPWGRQLGGTVTEPNERTSRTSRQSFRVHQELKDARNQSAASREILAALGKDAANTDAVLDIVVEYSARLCGAKAAQLS